MPPEIYDIAIIGGGINGCGIARDAVGRGLSVYLAEKDDLASATSSASTKLVHGGLRYLEHYEFRLVREALSEREVLLGMAPHIISPLRFVLPHDSKKRPAWLLRMGLFLYDHLGGRKFLPASRSVNLRTERYGEPLKEKFSRGFEYSDCWVDDARLVVLNAMDAANGGATIETRTEVTAARRVGGVWRVRTRSADTGVETEIQAKLLINAAGPWVADIITDCAGLKSEESVRLVKGSHIIVPRLFGHDRAYIFQNDDQRIIFAIPYEHDYTLIGTTDVDFQGDPTGVSISSDEVSYLASAASEYFRRNVRSEDVIWSYSGVRPLYNDGEGSAQETTRDYVLKMTEKSDGPAMLNIFGGKITTYRRLAEDAMSMIGSRLEGVGPAWTRGAALPGGDFPMGGVTRLNKKLASEYPSLPQPLISRLVLHYGTRTRKLLGDARDVSALGELFGADLFEAEVRYLMRWEFARTVDDVLWRRSKLGLRFTEAEAERLSYWMSEALPVTPTAAQAEQ